jgi:transcription elongation factor GreA
MIPSVEMSPLVNTMLPNKKTYLTQGGYQKLQSELNYLGETKRREIAEYLHEVMEGNGLEDNSEYLVAKNEQSLIEGRIQDLELLLSQAEIIQPGDFAGQFQVGSQVTIHDEKSRLETYTIVGSAEADARQGLISHESPMGQAY